MDFLIRAYWYQAEATKLHFKVTNAELQTQFQQAKKQQFPTAAAFQTFLTQSGQTMQDILFRVRVNAIYKKLLAKHQATVTAAAIQAYYTAHPTQFGTAESRDIRIVRTNTLAAANAAKKALESGPELGHGRQEVLDRRATKNKGGLLSGVTKGQEEQALDTAAFSAPVNKLIGPVHGQFGYYVVEVTKIKPATQQTLAQATPLIKQILTGRQQTAAQTAVDAQAKKAWQSQTKCRSDYAMADCAGYKAPATASTTAPAGAATTAPPATTTTSSK